MTEKLLAELGHDLTEITSGGIGQIGKEVGDLDRLAEELGIGAMTLEDIVKELQKPGRDPREDMPKPILRSDVLSMEDLKPGMVLKALSAMSLILVLSWISACTRTDLSIFLRSATASSGIRWRLYRSAILWMCRS